ncbi:MAG: two-component system chemotaxis family response regulator [Geobacteraceae bacterium]|nr:MAG: two-component system chemotaxis family response regulator [Geobacteraceae bacterium]
MKKILIAEDSSTMRSLLISTIGSLDGYEIVEAASGYDALRYLPREKVDLIITDINMPDINGLELINYIRNNPNYRDIPLFIISTERSEKDMEKGLALGANEYLTKPFDPVRLQELIHKYIG